MLTMRGLSSKVGSEARAAPQMAANWRTGWADPLPPHLRGQFIAGLANNFWSAIGGGIVCTALVFLLARMLGGVLPMATVAVAAVGFLFGAYFTRAIATSNLEDAASVRRLELTLAISSLLVSAGIGAIAFLVLAESASRSQQLLVFGIEIAVLGIITSAGASRPRNAIAEALLVALPSILAFALVWHDWVGMAAALGTAAYAMIVVITAHNNYRAKIGLLLARDEQRSERIRLAAAMAYLPHGLVILDQQDCIVVANDRCRAMLGYDPESDLSGRPFSDVMIFAPTLGLQTPEARKLFLKRAAVMESASQPFDTVMHLPGGRTMDFKAERIPGQGWVIVIRDTTSEKTALALASQEARRCPLSGLPNRRAFLEELDARCARVAAGGKPFALILADLDDFKQVNDHYGHAFGDQVIAATALRLRSAMTGLFVARLGGDEFAILVETAQVADASAIAVELAAAVSEPIGEGEIDLVVEMAAGIAQVPMVAPVPFDMMRAADLALLSAKKSQTANITVFEPQLLVDAEERTQTEARVTAAIRRGAINVAYQPIVDLHSQRVVAVEALARWPSNNGKPIATERLVRTAQHKRLLVDLRRIVVGQAAQVAARQGSLVSLWINVAVADLQGDVLATELSETLAQARLPLERLVIELTETALMTDVPASIATIQRLRSMGIRVALDDFGAGFSSLDRLRRLPLDALKISGNLISGAESDAGAADIVATAAALGRNMGLYVIAEGVETAGELAVVRNAGIDVVQGHLFGRAVKADALNLAIAAAERQLRTDSQATA
jgi:diguanylate cyclase (GGDEF)-like protein